MDDIPANPGDVISAGQVGAFKRDFGDKVFKAEPAFRVTEPSADGLYPEGRVLSATEREKALAANELLKTERALVGNEEGFVVTAVAKLPFKKGDVISSSEYELFFQKYPGRFSVMGESVTIEDPCYMVIEGGGSPFQRGDIILEREQRLSLIHISKIRKISVGDKMAGRHGNKGVVSRINLNELAASLRDEIGESTGPVSYTHLDVYKRQGPYLP